MSVSERLARAAWSRLSEPGEPTALALVSARGYVDALDLVRRHPDQHPRWAPRLAGLDPARDLDTVRRFGGDLLIPGDPGWPPGLDALGAQAPPCLWVRGGADLRVWTDRAVALVGARACTGYGQQVATELGAGCAENGATVVSGAAYGIDAAAHRGALSVSGPTIAVLACGVDRPYPAGNAQLLSVIADVGLVVSELPPGAAPTRWRFLARNRLIAALAGVCVVVEAAYRSGALSTARHADDLGRVLAAVPGPVTSAASAGCHRLLREAAAVCVGDAAEVLELLGPAGEQLTDPPAVPDRVHDGLPPADLRVLDALPLRSAAGLDSLTRAAGEELRTVLAALGRLELRGLAERQGGGWRRSPAPGGRSTRGGSPA